jgi:hypothetical protein
MNEAFRAYAFGRSFNVTLSERHVSLLTRLCQGDAIAAMGLDNSVHGLLRRGLVDFVHDAQQQRRFRPTRVGVLLFDLLVEAGETAALDELRRKTLDAENELDRLEWEERFGDVQVKLKDRFLRAGQVSEEVPGDA